MIIKASTLLTRDCNLLISGGGGVQTAGFMATQNRAMRAASTLSFLVRSSSPCTNPLPREPLREFLKTLPCIHTGFMLELTIHEQGNIKFLLLNIRSNNRFQHGKFSLFYNGNCSVRINLANINSSFHRSFMIPLE
jgi:hypothetical protein